ncbi:MAG TPA: hydrogenase 4 subunit B, partial [Paracoccaceae bacterium]|nr:hydrogenase 4 subunit B [Paracoccaceae bacterium]
MALVLALFVLALLLVLAAAGVFFGRREWAAARLHGAAGLLALLLVLAGAAGLAGEPASLRLPLGVPWIGAQFRLDALSGFFLGILGLGGAAASTFAVGYARHEPEPWRMLPFYPAFLGGMALVILADDAFTFLLSWE